MTRRCKLTKKYMFLVKFFLTHVPLKPLKKNLSSMILSRVGRKLETDKFFEAQLSESISCNSGILSPMTTQCHVIQCHCFLISQHVQGLFRKVELRTNS